MINEVAARLREEPEMLFRMPGMGTQSGWISGRLRSLGASPAHRCRRAVGASRADVRRMGRRSRRCAHRHGAGPRPRPASPAQQFAAGITDHRDGRAAPFDAALFTPAAMTAGRASVAIDEDAVARRGRDPRGVVQASDGLPPYDFALFRTGPNAADGEDDVTLVSGRESRVVRPVRTWCSGDERPAAHRRGRRSAAACADGVAPAAHRVWCCVARQLREAHLRLVLRSGRTDVAQIRAMLPPSVAEHADEMASCWSSSKSQRASESGRHRVDAVTADAPRTDDGVEQRQKAGRRFRRVRSG